MDRAEIIEQLETERMRLTEAIEALIGQAPTNHRVKMKPLKFATRRPVSKDEHERRSQAQKARWAIRKAKEKKNT
jgi:hypothetical protein